MQVSENVIIVDGLNDFTRNFIVNPFLNQNGEPIGGYIGFLKALELYLTKMNNPKKIIIVWDGKGGGVRRRNIYPEYKAGRKVPRINRFYDEYTEDETIVNRKLQLLKLWSALKYIPVHQITIDGCEADDVIGYLVNTVYKNDRKVIISNDKDFFQLLNKNTIIYRTIKKEFVNYNTVKKQFNILPENFALARAFEGDNSDKIDGIKGIGLKGISKLFPVMAEKLVTIEDLLEIVKQTPKIGKKHQLFIDNVSIVERNNKLMQLDDSLLSLNQIKEVEYALTKPLNYDKVKLLKVLSKEGVATFNYNWIDKFLYLYKQETK